MALREKYLWGVAVAAAALSACTTGTLSDPPGDSSNTPDVPGAPQAFTPPAPTIRRLLGRQYRNSVRDLLGPAAAAAASPPGDSSLNGFDAIGAAQLGVSDDAVTKYEVSARAVAAAAMGDTARIGSYLSCDPAAPADASACRKDFAKSFGRLAFRRPLDAEEIERYAGVAEVASSELGDFNSGIEYAILAFLQSPSFLYQVEVGNGIIDVLHPTLRRLDGYEMASRMSFFLLGTTPSPALLDDAEKGLLSDAEGVRNAAKALLEKPEARAALDSFYAEFLGLRDLDGLVKDEKIFPQFSPKLAQAMREETLRLIDDTVWEQNGDYRDILDADYTFVNGDLASLYGLPAPEGDGSDFIKVQLPAEQKRGGLLGQASFLSLFSHTSLSSPTLRGKFVRERLLCQAIPAPPPNVNTVLPSDPNAKTARQKLEVHQTAPGCKSCHVAMDLIGFGLENYDAVGAFRTTENGETIDAKSEVAGMGTFEGARELGSLLRDDPKVSSCVVRNIFRGATGHIDTTGESPALEKLDASFADSGYRMQDLLVELVASDAFRLVGVVE